MTRQRRAANFRLRMGSGTAATWSIRRWGDTQPMSGAIIGGGIGVVGIIVAICVPLVIERLKRPSFAFRVAEPSHIGSVKYLHVAIINRPLTSKWLLRNTATGCTASLSYESLPIGSGEHRPWGAAARWSAKAEPWTPLVVNGRIERLYDDTKLNNCFHMDLEPSDRGEVVIAAIKHADDKAAYALSTDSYGPDSDGELRAPSLVLPGPEYKLTVVVEAGGRKCPGDFRVRNGDGHDGFYIEPWRVRPAGGRRRDEEAPVPLFVKDFVAFRRERSQRACAPGPDVTQQRHR